MKTTKSKSKSKGGKKAETTTALSKPEDISAMIRGDAAADVPEDMNDMAFPPYVYFWSEKGGESSKEIAETVMPEGKDMELGHSFLIAEGQALRLDDRKDVFLQPIRARVYYGNMDTESTLLAAARVATPGMKECGHGIALLVVKDGDSFMATPIHFRAGRGRVDGIRQMVKSIKGHAEPSERQTLRFTSPVTPNNSAKVKWTGFKAPIAKADEERSAFIADVLTDPSILADAMESYLKYDKEINDLIED